MRFCMSQYHNLDLEDSRPLLAGHKQPVMLGVVGDSVQDGLGIDLLIVGQDAGQVDPGDDVPVLR